MHLCSDELHRIFALVILSGLTVCAAALRESWPEDQERPIDPPIDLSADRPLSEAYVFGAPLDLNAASPEAIALLPGVGRTLAARIAARAPYRSIDELDAIRGLGPKLIATLRREAIIRAPTSPPARRAPPAPSKIARAG